MADINISYKTNLIWTITDKLTSVYKPHKYGLVILLLTVIIRFECILLDKKSNILDFYDKSEEKGISDFTMGTLLRNAYKHLFYNTSKFTFEDLLG